MDSSRREREAKYWEEVAADRVGIAESRIQDNVYKRQVIVGRLLLACEWKGEKVLEIGIGAAVAAAAIQVTVLGRWNYTGTDLSPLFVQNARETFRLNAVQTDVTELPGLDYTRVICLDSLEHVHPDDRVAGYSEIARVTAQGGLLLINMPLSTDPYHDREFDHPFGLDDLHRIEQAGFRARSFERYSPRAGNPGTQIRPSAFVVMERT